MRCGVRARGEVPHPRGRSLGAYTQDMLTLRNAAAALAAGALLFTSACQSNVPGPDGPLDLHVFAAASLNDAFTEIGEKFAQENPDIVVDFNFGGSSGLVTQMEEGAPADVFASADEQTMTTAAQKNLMSTEPTVFATNTLTIAVAPGNPENITGLSDLTRVDTALCAPEVPCGNASQQVLQAAGVTLKPVTEESSVTDVLTKVTSGQVDAGLVYSTDAKSAGAGTDSAQIDAVDFPEAQQSVNSYPIGVTGYAADKGRVQGAQKFVDYVLSPAGQQVLAAHGFGEPD